MMVSIVCLYYVFSIIIVTTATKQEHTIEEVHEKFATPCTTPNNDFAFCVEVQECTIFIDSLASGNTKNHDFIRASRCGPDNEHIDKPKVCCGKHPDFMPNKGGSTTTYSPPVVTPSTPTTNEPSSHDDYLFSTKKCGNQTILLPSRIFGGTTADLGEFPWIARLRHKRKNDGLLSYGCVGFLISERFVLTAAHCILSKALAPIGTLYQVQLGEHDTLHTPDCVEWSEKKWCADPPQLLRTAKPITHKKYSNDYQQYNDIALIPLKDRAKLTAFVYPICLATSHLKQTEMWLSGWGKTEHKAASSTKMKVLIPRTGFEFCKNLYIPVGIHITDSQLCAGGEAGKDSCSGDSGGPIMTQIGTGPWYAEGIVSFGMGCGLEGWPGIYTDITAYKPWIKQMANRYLRKKEERRRQNRNKKINKILSSV